MAKPDAAAAALPADSREVVRFLSAIPSETSPGERALLFDHFRGEWSGDGHVVEIGPFLGGTTRAMACGMMANPRRTPEARLHTFDRFAAYYDPARLRSAIAPLVTSGVFSAEHADGLAAAGDFLAIFDAIHRPHDYARLLVVHSSPLPDFPEELPGASALAPLEAESDLAALFIDGCKSWAATHYAMRFLLPRTRLGAPIIFQDYGWYTCFWISAFAFALDDALELKRWVDSTYVFTLKRNVSADEIVQRFAEKPEDMGIDFFKRSCLALMKRSVARKDLRGGLVAQLHLVAALATLGREAEARAILTKIDPTPYGRLGRMIEGSKKSPTYRPGNRPIAWSVA
jgi:hypothetical protein